MLGLDEETATVHRLLLSHLSQLAYTHPYQYQCTIDSAHSSRFCHSFNIRRNQFCSMTWLVFPNKPPSLLPILRLGH